MIPQKMIAQYPLRHIDFKMVSHVLSKEFKNEKGYKVIGMKIGRNDPCPCGSGKKYKHCCLKKDSMSTEQLIRAAVSSNGYDDKISNVLCNLNSYMQKKQWWGSCHASCSALYVAFSELGYSPKLCIGEMMGQGLYFDHSWIELDGRIIDMAISMTLLDGAPLSEPILFGKNIRNSKEPAIEYGFPGRGLGDESRFVMNIPFTDYMDAFPDEKNGLWDVVRELLGMEIDIDYLRIKYRNVERVLVRKESGK